MSDSDSEPSSQGILGSKRKRRYKLQSSSSDSEANQENCTGVACQTPATRTSARQSARKKQSSQKYAETPSKDEQVSGSWDDVNKQNNLSRTPATRSSKRIRSRNSREFNLPDREKALEMISPGNVKHPEIEEERVKALRPRRLVNNFIRERNSYVTERVADCWGSDGSLADFIADSDEDVDEGSSSSSSSSDNSIINVKRSNRKRSRKKDFLSEDDQEESKSSRSKMKSKDKLCTSNDSDASDAPLASVVQIKSEKYNSDSSDEDIMMSGTQKRRFSSSKKLIITDSENEETEEVENSPEKVDLHSSPVKEKERPKSQRVRNLTKRCDEKKKVIFNELLETRRRAKLEPKARLAVKQEQEFQEKQPSTPETSEEEEESQMSSQLSSFWGESENSDEYETDFVVSSDESDSDDGMNSDRASQFMELLDTYTHKGDSNIDCQEIPGVGYFIKTPKKQRKKKKRSRWSRIVNKEESEESDEPGFEEEENAKEQKINPPLHIAVMDNDIEAVKNIIKESPESVYAIGPRRRTALHLAAMIGNAPMVRVLLRHRADRTALDKYQFPAIAYAANGHHDSLRILLEHSDIKAINKSLLKTASSMSLLHFAVGDGRNGMECSARGRCMEMLFSFSKKACERVLERKDSRGRTPLVAAVYAGQHQCVAVLLKHGANPFTFKTESGGNMLHFAVECSSYMDVEEEDFNTSLCLRQLIDRLKLQIEQREETTAFTPLMRACVYGNADCVAALIEAGATPMCTDCHKTSSLHLAAMAGDTRCVQVLLDSGHQVDCVDKYGWPPLLYANFKAQESCVLALMKPKPEQLFVLGNLLKMPGNEAQKKKTFRVVKNALKSLANHDAYYTVFNDFIRRNPEMLEENNHGLLQHTWKAILDFDNKHRWFKRKLAGIRGSYNVYCDRISICVDRQDILGSAMKQLGRTLGHAFRNRSLHVTFRDEPGICTGPKREFFVCLCKDAVDAKRGLFMVADDSQYSPLPNAYFAKIMQKRKQHESVVKKESPCETPSQVARGHAVDSSTVDDSTDTEAFSTLSNAATSSVCSLTSQQDNGSTAVSEARGTDQAQSVECSDQELINVVDLAERQASESGAAQAPTSSDNLAANPGPEQPAATPCSEETDEIGATSLADSGFHSTDHSESTTSCSRSDVGESHILEALNEEMNTPPSQNNGGATCTSSVEQATSEASQGDEAARVDDTTSHAPSSDAPTGVEGNEKKNETWISCQDGPKDQSTVNVALRSKLKQLHLIGRLVGAAICDGMLLNLQLSKPFVKQILGIPLSHPEDLSSFDHDLHKNAVTWVLENSVDYLDLPFSIDAVNPWTGQPGTIELSEEEDKALCDTNKHEYVKLVSKFKLEDSIKCEVDEFAGGLEEVVPRDLLSFFTADEFSLLINGVSKIDVVDWRANTLYQGCSSTDEIVGWLWNTISRLKEEEKALLLKFSTGSPCVPIGGLLCYRRTKKTKGLSGPNKFTVVKTYGTNKIPQASTCFNQLKLSEYDNEKQLREKLLIAIRHGSEGFSFS